MKDFSPGKCWASESLLTDTPELDMLSYGRVKEKLKGLWKTRIFQTVLDSAGSLLVRTYNTKYSYLDPTVALFLLHHIQGLEHHAVKDSACQLNRAGLRHLLLVSHCIPLHPNFVPNRLLTHGYHVSAVVTMAEQSHHILLRMTDQGCAPWLRLLVSSLSGEEGKYTSLQSGQVEIRC